MKKQPKQAFTLIELLTVIAIIGILASILIPTVGKVREAARKTVDASNVRQIGQASLIYANDNREALPSLTLDPNTGLEGGTTSLQSVAVALALGGGLNDAQLWVSQSDRGITQKPGGTILGPPSGTAPREASSDFKKLYNGPGGGLSFSYVAGLRTASPSTTPIAFTRGLQKDGKWSNQTGYAVYGSDGGHMVFLGGNVQWNKDLGSGTTTGKLITVNGSDAGKRTEDITKAIPTTSEIQTKGPGNMLEGETGS